MKWTTTAPTVPGWYWVKPEGYGFSVVKVDEVDEGMECNWGTWRLVDEVPNSPRWFGPITPPEDDRDSTN